MTEDEARWWVEERFGEQANVRLARFLATVEAENVRQNLISPASVANMWSRHAVDSAQLLLLAPPGWRSWIDVGSGGGFPGMVVALLAPDRHVSLVEPRRRRAEFLQSCCKHFGLTHAEAHVSKIESVALRVDVISARAVASIENLLRTSRHCATSATTWLLPRGRSGAVEASGLAGLQRTMFHVEQSITDAESSIVVLKGDGT